MDFLTYGLQKTWLVECLKSPVLEHPLTSNMAHGPKQFPILNETNFSVFIDPSSGNSGWKSLSEFYANS